MGCLGPGVHGLPPIRAQSLSQGKPEQVQVGRREALGGPGMQSSRSAGTRGHVTGIIQPRMGVPQTPSHRP